MPGVYGRLAADPMRSAVRSGVLEIAGVDVVGSGGKPLDKTAPVTAFGKTPKKKSRRKKATFEFAADEPASFTCGFDSKPRLRLRVAGDEEAAARQAPLLPHRHRHRGQCLGDRRVPLEDQAPPPLSAGSGRGRRARKLRPVAETVSKEDVSARLTQAREGMTLLADYL